MNKMNKLLNIIWKSIMLKIILLLGIIFLILLDAWGLTLFNGKIDCEKFGTVGDWFSNIAMLLAIVLAAATIRNDKLIAENEHLLVLQMREEDQKKKDLDQKMQAELLTQAVYVWIGGTQDPVTNQMRDFKMGLSNKTEAPIFTWCVYDSINNKLADSGYYGPIFPGQFWISVPDLNPSMNLTITFTSFLGKGYSRNGAEVKEVNLHE